MSPPSSPGTLTLKVMTFNLRFDNPEDGPQRWTYRKEAVIRTILEEEPDLVGTQEGMPVQLQYLDRHLKGYRKASAWRVRDDDPRIQCPTIYYLRKSLVLEGGGEFWLSETPHVHRSRSWGSAFPRLFTFAKFRHRPSAQRFWFADTHLDHVSQRAREEGACLIARWVKSRRLPVVLVGDFNDLPESAVHEILTGSGTPLKDTWRSLQRPEDEAYSTVHHFQGRPFGGRIDWILVSEGIEVLDAKILNELLDGPYPSDHFPYLAELRLP